LAGSNRIPAGSAGKDFLNGVHSRSFGVQSTIKKADAVAFLQKWPMDFI
jgi:hypothetical protein